MKAWETADLLPRRRPFPPKGDSQERRFCPSYKGRPRPYHEGLTFLSLHLQLIQMPLHLFWKTEPSVQVHL